MDLVYNDYFLNLLSEENIILENNIVENAITEMGSIGKIDIITNYVSELLNKIDNRTFMKFDEKYVQLLYYSLLHRYREFRIYNEYPCSNGYIDLMLFKNHEFYKYNIMIELKYIKQKDYNKGLLKRKIEEGRNQLISYSEDERITKDTKKYLVVFVGNKVKVLKEV